MVEHSFWDTFKPNLWIDNLMGTKELVISG